MKIQMLKTLTSGQDPKILLKFTIPCKCTKEFKVKLVKYGRAIWLLKTERINPEASVSRHSTIGGTKLLSLKMKAQTIY